MYWVAILPVLLSYTSSLKIKSHDGACKVITDKGVLDMSALAGTGGKARFTGIPGIHASQAITTYDWNPCRDFNDTNPGDKFDKNCFNVAVCQVTEYGSTGYTDYMPSGKTSTASFTADGDTIILHYTMPSGFGMKTDVKLTCSSGADSVTYNQAKDAELISLELKSASVCLKPLSSGLSAGSVLCILLLVLVIVYLVGGVLFMTFVKKAEGASRVPNLSFWTSLPGLVKEGFQFAICCKSSGSGAKYDSI